MRFKEVYKRLNGREATTEQVLKFERLVASLETTPSDAMLSVLVALDHYENLYSEIPKKINTSASKLLDDFKTAANQQAITALASAKADLSKAVGQVAEKVAADVSQKQRLQWIAGSIVISFACLLITAMLAHKSGRKTGEATGYEQAKDEKSAASWANTPQGQQAYRLAQIGELDKLTKCAGKGWSIEKGVCYPKEVSGEGTYGWRIP